MKKVISLVVAYLLVIGGYCQEHMTFKGIPIDGSITEFKVKMQNIGYTYVEQIDDKIYSFSGKFMNEDCKVFVVVTPMTQTVWKVMVKKPNISPSWYRLKGNYNNVKTSYIEKYGEPKNDFHFFISPYYAGDGYELTALKIGKCNYAAGWENEHGNILLQLQYGCIEISYEDSYNLSIYEKEKSNIISNDI